jgi:hypothetical protein
MAAHPPAHGHHVVGRGGPLHGRQPAADRVPPPEEVLQDVAVPAAAPRPPRRHALDLQLLGRVGLRVGLLRWLFLLQRDLGQRSGEIPLRSYAGWCAPEPLKALIKFARKAYARFVQCRDIPGIPPLPPCGG